MQSVLIISSGQPSANPRLVKEAKALNQAGYEVTVIYVPLSPWADKFDQELFRVIPEIKFIRAGYHPNYNKLCFSLSRLRRRFLKLIFYNYGNIRNIADYCTILFGQELLREAKKYKANLYIAHNLGALPVAVKVAKHYRARVGFDAEDFHRGEIHNGSVEYKLTKIIEEKYIPKIDYMTAASPLIAEQYNTLFNNKPIVINNVFQINNIAGIRERRSNSILRLFWFSQTIGKGRGIESAVKAVCEDLKDEHITLTLMGNCSPQTKIDLEGLVNTDIFYKKVFFLKPVNPDNVVKIAHDFDVGLALEPGRDLNNNIALSNKMFTYVMAGNSIIATDTAAQRLFMEEHKNIGLLCERDNPIDLANKIRIYLNYPHLLSLHQNNAYYLAKTDLNWEKESQKLLSTIKDVLS